MDTMHKHLERFAQLYRHYRGYDFNYTAANTAVDYARARMWLDAHKYQTKNGEFCEPRALADAEACGYTGVVWTEDEWFDVDDFYGYEAPLQEKATDELIENLMSGRWEARALFLLVDGEIVDALSSIVTTCEAHDLDRYEVEMASAWREKERGAVRLVRAGFAL
jgi:hypothetical protein